MKSIPADDIDLDREIVRTSFESVMAQILCLIDDQYSGLKKVNCEANLKVSPQDSAFDHALTMVRGFFWLEAWARVNLYILAYVRITHRMKESGCGEASEGVLDLACFLELVRAYPFLCCSWTSVVKGAVHCEYMELGNTHLINTRLSRWNYGIPFRETYDPMKHREEDRYHDPHWKSEKARNQVCWLVKKVGQLFLQIMVRS